MRLIVCGSRSFVNYTLLARTLDRLTAKLDRKKLVIVSGHAKGADQLGERWCRERLVPYQIYHAEWEKYGKSAGYKRNAEMIASCTVKDGVVAFWDGKSAGTQATIEMARKAGLRVVVVRV